MVIICPAVTRPCESIEAGNCTDPIDATTVLPVNAGSLTYTFLDDNTMFEAVRVKGSLPTVAEADSED